MFQKSTGAEEVVNLELAVDGIDGTRNVCLDLEEVTKASEVYYCALSGRLCPDPAGEWTDHNRTASYVSGLRWWTQQDIFHSVCTRNNSGNRNLCNAGKVGKTGKYGADTGFSYRNQHGGN